MEKKMLAELRFLKIYAILSTVIFSSLLFMAFHRGGSDKQYFQELDVERINIIEKDGALKMVISNAGMQHPGTVDGKMVPARQRPAGIIFFNSIGDECGGLVYDGDKKEAGLAFSVDQYKNDQIMQLQYEQATNSKDKNRSYGLKLWDRSDDYTEAQLMKKIDSLKRLNNKTLYTSGIADMKAKGILGNERMFVGKTNKEEVGLFIRDSKGRPRIRIYVDKNEKGMIEFLDSTGKAMPLN